MCICVQLAGAVNLMGACFPTCGAKNSFHLMVLGYTSVCSLVTRIIVMAVLISMLKSLENHLSEYNNCSDDYYSNSNDDCSDNLIFGSEDAEKTAITYVTLSAVFTGIWLSVSCMGMLGGLRGGYAESAFEANHGDDEAYDILPSGGRGAVVQQAQSQATPISSNFEERLRTLKNLKEQKLITEDAYDEAVRNAMHEV